MFDIQSVRDYLHGLNQKETIRIMAIFFICFSCIIGFLLLRHVNLLQDIEQKT